MKQRIILLLILSYCHFSSAQNIFTEVIASYGFAAESTHLKVECTVGEVMVEAYDNGTLQLTQGLHQGYSYIQSDIILSDQIISGGHNECFSALQTIVTENFVVEQGSGVVLIAGQQINLLNGTKVHHGGNLLAYITTTGSFCENPRNLLTVNTVTNENYPTDNSPVKIMSDRNNFVHVYPNPNSGQFFIKINDPDNYVPINIEIFGMLGEKVYHCEVTETENYLIDISHYAKGFYIIRIHHGQKTWIEKISKL